MPHFVQFVIRRFFWQVHWLVQVIKPENQSSNTTLLRILTYNRTVTNISRAELLKRSLTPERLNLLHLIADVAGLLGFPIYIVGGSVRDLLLDRVINDFDLTVEGDAAVLEEFILRKLGGKIIIHSHFGTARWTLNESTFHHLGVPVLEPEKIPAFFDFISARSETYLHAGALPTVKRATIEEDLRRRDFTINAMAIRLDGFHFGELVDPLNGQADLERGLIRILHPNSFMDDPTRMLRAVRYAGRYGFEIEPGTLNLINEEARIILSRLSGERLRHEFDLIFEEQNPAVLLNRLSGLDILKSIYPSLASVNTQLPPLDDPSSEFGELSMPGILSFRQTLGWNLWLMPLPHSDIDVLAKRLDFPVALTRSARAASSLLAALPSFANWKPSQWTFHLDELPALAVYAVYLVRKEHALRDYLVNWKNIKPTITGNDLKERGLEPGPRYAEVLRQLRAAWLDGEIKRVEEEKLLLDKLIQ